MPARASTLGIAAIGPMPMTSGGTPATAKPAKRASGLRLNSRRMRSDTRTTAAAPSDICELLPAVTLPRAANTGFSRASASALLSGRGPSSTSTSRRTTRTAPLASGRCDTTS
ncbi:hypothetical protein D9M68_540230 [compost metagenome]